METFAYLHAAQEYEYPEEKEINLKWVNPAALTLLGIACSTWEVNLASVAHAATASRGDSGADVTRLQDLLRNAGYFPTAPTGFFGAFTEAAVHDFQKAKGLAVDGVAGYHTFKILETPVTPVAPAPIAPGTPVTPTVPGSGVGTAALGFGDSGLRVTQLQDLLRRAGYFTGPSTGFFGALTRDSVKRFQQANRLPVDAFVGQATLAALGSAPAAGATLGTGSPTIRPPAITRLLRQGDSGEDVRALQQRLLATKYYTGPITGVYGTLTEAAVRELQRAKGLPIDGVFGAKSATALR